MAYRRIDTMDISEIIRLLRAGESDRSIARLLGHNRRTIVRYRSWAAEQGLLDGEPMPQIQLQRLLATTLPPPFPPQQTSSVATYAGEIAQLRDRGMEIAREAAGPAGRAARPSGLLQRRVAAGAAPGADDARTRGSDRSDARE